MIAVFVRQQIINASWQKIRSNNLCLKSLRYLWSKKDYRDRVKETTRIFTWLLHWRSSSQAFYLSFPPPSLLTHQNRRVEVINRSSASVIPAPTLEIISTSPTSIILLKPPFLLMEKPSSMLPPAVTPMAASSSISSVPKPSVCYHLLCRSFLLGQQVWNPTFSVCYPLFLCRSCLDTKLETILALF